MLYLWSKWTSFLAMSESLRKGIASGDLAIFKKRRWNVRYSGADRSAIKYPAYTTAEIHAMNLYNTTPLIISGKVAGRQTQLLIDSGASLTLINLQLFNQLPYYYRKQVQLPPPYFFLQLADRSRLNVKYQLTLPITISNSTRNHIVYVVPQLWRPCIIGNDLIQKHNLQIDGGRQKAYFKNWNKVRTEPTTTVNSTMNENTYKLIATETVKIPAFHVYNIEVRPDKPFNKINEENPEEYEISSLKVTPCVANGIITPQRQMFVQVANLTNKMAMIHTNQPIGLMVRLDQTQIHMIQHGTQTIESDSLQARNTEEPNLSNTNLSAEQKQQLREVIMRYPEVFNDKTGRTTKLQHQINLKPDARPYNSPPFRYAPARRQIIEQNLKEMTEQGIISPSKSPWASPVILAPKKDGNLRFCIDYRKLNSMTIRDAYPIPRIDDTLDSLQEAKFVSTLDLRSGYWQVEMDPEAREKTAFVTHKGLFEFNVMPFGLTNAPATFQRLMDIVLAGLKWQCCLVYIDDVVIFSSTFEQHLRDLDKVFSALKDAKLTLKASKCQFCRPEMRYLGHIITQSGIKPDPELIKSVIEFPRPRRIKDIQSFLGLTGYYRRFIRDYAKIAEPLLKQLRNGQKANNHHIQWTQECESAFDSLKKKLTNAPIMNTPNFEAPFILELDACEYGLGAVLTQEYENQKYVIAYASRTLSSPERKYGATEREALAIVWAVKHFRPYLEGSKIYIRSDCKALEWMRTAKDVTGRIARWAMKLAPFHIEEIKYRPGKANANADSLSRNPIENKEERHLQLSTIETAINLWENTNILDNITVEQQKDTKLLPIIKRLQTTTPEEFNTKRNPFVLINGLLYKIKNSNRHYNQRVLGNKHLIVIPTSMQQKLLEWAHDHPTAGHSGQQKTLFRLSTRVYWESMRKDVYNYVRTCTLCQQFKYDNSPSSSPMQIHTINEPWQTIGIDIMGPFPVTARHKRFLLVVVDYFTRWVEIFPISSTTAPVVAEILLDQVFSRYGLPKYILSDNGPQFVSNIFRAFCTIMQIDQKFTANYHPQTNMTERVNRTLKPLISIYAHRQPHSWDKEIQRLAFAIRTSINETTGETPAFLMFGRDIRGPLDLITGDQTSGPPPTTCEQKQIQEYKSNLINTLRCAYAIVNERSDIEKYNQKLKYDRHTTQRDFNIDDLVWVSIPTNQIGDNHIKGKLQAQYQGPCRLTKQLGPNTFIALRISDNVDLGATNVDRMKPYLQPVVRLPRIATDTTKTPHNNVMPRSNQNQLEKNDQPFDYDRTITTTVDPQNQKQSPSNDAEPVRFLPSRAHRKPARYLE